MNLIESRSDMTLVGLVWTELSASTDTLDENGSTESMREPLHTARSHQTAPYVLHATLHYTAHLTSEALPRAAVDLHSLTSTACGSFPFIRRDYLISLHSR